MAPTQAKRGKTLPLRLSGLHDAFGMNPRDFGQRVYRLRMDRQWTQVMCADRVGISLRNLRMIETYKSSPTLETVEKLAAAFRCSWEDLLGSPTKSTDALSITLDEK